MNTGSGNQTTQKTADTARSVHLSASAGSGKTRALKERCLALLDLLDRSGLGIDQVVAITFTDKAAAEIKERVMHDLPEAMLKKIIRGRQDLRISTIHSFCMNLLKRYPLEAGLPPDFGVLDARDQAYKIQKAIEDALEESDRDPEVMAPLRDFGADELVSTIEFLLSTRSRLKRIEIDAGGPDKLRQAVGTGMGTGASESEMQSLLANLEWRSLFSHMERFLISQGAFYEECRGREHGLLAAADDAHAACRIAASLSPVYFTQRGEPRKKLPISRTKFINARDFRYPAYETLYEQARDALSRLLSACRRAQSAYEAIGFLRLFQRAGERYQDSKLREGLLDFDDLEIYAYRLLRSAESPDILYWLDRKILHFLVDEFQDTSDIQWAILNKLTEEIFAGLGADKPMPPTLFVVGDEKQSIYRFREANYRLIENVRRRMEENIPAGSREIRTLDKNYRSVPEVIGTANKVFSALWGGSYQPSETERKDQRGSVRLIELLPGASEESPSDPTEAEVLAREIRLFVEKGTKVYEKPPDSRCGLPGQDSGRGGKDGKGWNERKAGYGDCAVLIQSRTRLKEYEAALRKEGVPYRVVGGIGFYEEDEIQAVLNVLFFLWNRDDKFSLAAALKSALFGLTDKDIFDLMQDNGNMVEALRHRRPDDGKLLHDWMSIAGLVSLPDLIHRIIGETGAYIRFGRINPQAIFNLDKLLDTAREFDRRGYTMLQDFVERVKNIRESEQREATADMNLPGFQGAVSIMTVHKAKGLEFPVVFLPGMNQQPKSVSTGPPAIIEGDGRSVRMAVKDAGNRVYDELWEQEKEELRREHQRLLYVAMTRARDHLVMIGALASGKNPAKENAWLSYLHQAVPALREISGDAAPRVIAASYPEWRARALPVAQPAFAQTPVKGREQETVADAKAVIENISPIPVSESPEWKKATDFVDHDREELVESPFPGPESKVFSPLTRGSVLHRCLEEFTRRGRYELDRIIDEFPEAQVPEQGARDRLIADAGSVLRSVIGNGELAWIFEQQPGAYSELPFLYKKGRNLVSGIIDRVIVKEGKGFVIDYKAVLIENDEALASWKEHYLPQIRIYCEAVKHIFKLDTVEGYLLFLDSNRLEPVVSLRQ